MILIWLCVFQLTGASSLDKIMGSKSNIHPALVASTSDTALIGSSEGTILEYSLATGLLKRNLVGHANTINQLLLINETALLSASYDGNIILWDLFTGKRVRTFSKAGIQFHSVATRDGIVYGGTSEGTILVFDLNSGKFLKQFNSGSRSRVISLAVNDKYLFSGEDESLMLLMWDRNSGQTIRKFDNIDGYVRRLNLVRNYLFASLDYNSRLKNTLKFDINSGDLIYSFPENSGHYAVIRNDMLYSYDEPLISIYNIYNHSLLSTINVGNVGYVFAVSNDYLIFNDLTVFPLRNLSFASVYKLPVELFGWSMISVVGNNLIAYNFDSTIKRIDLVSGKWLSSIDPKSNQCFYCDISFRVYQNSVFFSQFGNIVEYNLLNGSFVGIVDYNCSEYVFLYEEYLFYQKNNLGIVQYDLKNRSIVYIFSLPETILHDKPFLINSHYIIFSSVGNSAARINLNSGMVTVYSGFSNVVASFCETDYGYVFGSYNGELYLMDPDTGTLKMNFIGHTFMIMTCSAVGNVLYSGATDALVISWNILSGVILTKFTGQISSVRSLFITGNTLFASTVDGIKQYDLTSSRLLNTFSDNRYSIRRLFWKDGALLVARPSGKIEIWDVEHGSIQGYKYYSEGLLIGDFCLRKGLLFWTTGLAIYYSAENNTEIQLGSHLYDLTSLYCKEDFIISGDQYGGLKIWNWTMMFNSVYSVSRNDSQSIQAIIFWEPDRFYSAGDGGFVQEWVGLQNPKQLRKFDGLSSPIYCLAIFNNFLFSAGADKIIRKWSLASGSLITEFKRAPGVLGHLGSINAIIDSNGYLFSASGDLTIKIWNIDTGKVLETLFGPYQRITTLLLDGVNLFCGGDDQFIFKYSIDDIYTQEYFIKTTSSIVGTSLEAAKAVNQIVSSGGLALWIYLIIGAAVIGLCLFMFLMLRLRHFRRLIKNANGDTMKNDSEITSWINQEGTLFTKHLPLSGYAYKEVDSLSFRMLELLFKGGGGSVYLGEALTAATNKYGKEIIVKLISKDFESLRQIEKDSFMQEISIMTMLGTSKGIALSIGYCKVPCCILMKKYKCSLDQWILENPIRLKKVVLDLLIDIVQGLKTLHEAHIVHCDIKAQNILLGYDYELKRDACVITDFGISRILSEDILGTRYFRVANLNGLSSAYAPPEAFLRFRTKQKIQDNLKEGDIYCFGGILYMCIVKRRPWKILSEYSKQTNVKSIHLSSATNSSGSQTKE